MKRIVVLVAHGTVENLEDLPAFLQEIRRGRPAPPELLAELEERYRAVGGSPHLQETKAQAAAVQRATGLETRTAMRLWDPRVSAVTFDLGPEDEIILVPLAPFSVGVYEQAARRELDRRTDPPRLKCVPPWGSQPALISAHVRSISAACAGFGADDSVSVILTAHSLPTAVIQAGDRYAKEFEAAAATVASQLPFPVTTAYQSQGAGGGNWLGPTLHEAMSAAVAQGATKLVVAPIGFLSEHIETLYDLDIEAKGQAEALGVSFTRVPTLSVSPGLIEAIASAIAQT